jgi:hypothetical protein
MPFGRFSQLASLALSVALPSAFEIPHRTQLPRAVSGQVCLCNQKLSRGDGPC